MTVRVLLQGEPYDSEITHDPLDNTFEVKVFDDRMRVLKVGGPYRTEQAARFADQRMMGLQP